MGAPPHGGIALGIDRFDRVASGRAEHPRRRRVPEDCRAALDPMSGAPSEVPQEQLEELGIRFAGPPEPDSA